MKKIKKEEEEAQVKLCRQELQGMPWLNLKNNFSQQESLYYQEPTFEIPIHEKKIDWEAPHFNTSRTMTVKNIRDIFFCLLNTSVT